MKLNIVPARTGFQWVKLGLRTFMRQPLALAALVFMYSTVAVAMLLVPVVGPFLMMALVPVGTLGLMAATKVAESGAFPMPTLLLIAFRASRDRVKSMFVLGALYAAALFAIVAIVSSLVQVPGDAKTATDVVDSPEFRIVIAWSALLYVPISLAFWHAPALVHWYGVPPIKSLFFSFVACMRNLKAFTAYSVAWLAVAGVIFGASSVAAAFSPWLAGVVFGATSTIATIAFYVSLYFTFRDSFVGADDIPGEQT